MVSREEQQKRQVLEGVRLYTRALLHHSPISSISILASMQNVPSGWLRGQ